MRYGVTLRTAVVLGSIVAGASCGAAGAAEKARISGLADVNFGQITGTVDQAIGQSLCVYSSSPTGAYGVTASGSGSGGSFALSSGSAELAYDVLWADAPNQSSGMALLSGTPRGGFTSNASQHFCNSGPSSTATLTIVIRSAELGNAQAGSYSGMLQITITPE
jgi:hypothetical protein